MATEIRVYRQAHDEPYHDRNGQPYFVWEEATTAVLDTDDLDVVKAVMRVILKAVTDPTRVRIYTHPVLNK